LLLFPNGCVSQSEKQRTPYSFMDLFFEYPDLKRISLISCDCFFASIDPARLSITRFGRYLGGIEWDTDSIRVRYTLPDHELLLDLLDGKSF
jgi:hypothetical protein